MKMPGAQQYTDLEIAYILTAWLAGKTHEWTNAHWMYRFRRVMRDCQTRYVRNKYGRDPRFE